MKRIISFIIVVMTLSLCLGVCSFAEEKATFLDDFSKMYYGDESYSRIDASKLVTDDSNVIPIPYSLSTLQMKTVSGVDLMAGAHADIIYATVNYRDGAALVITFLKDSLRAEYDAIMSGSYEKCVVDFQFPVGNTVTTEKNHLRGDYYPRLYKDDLSKCSFFVPVYAQNDSGTLRVEVGSLLVYGRGEYYYVDFKQEGIIPTLEPFSPHNMKSLNVFTVNDEELLAALDEAEDRYYSDDFGYLFNDELSESISTVFVIVALVVLPLALLILFLIFAIRSNGTYRKLCIAVCSTSVVLMITVSAIYLIVKLFA